MRYLSIYIPALLLFSCSETEEKRDIGQRYFPLDGLRNRVYQIDSIRYNAFSGTSDTMQYFESYQFIGPPVISGEDLRIEVRSYDSSAASGQWNIRGEMEWFRNNFRAESKDDMGRMVKLVFPVLLNKRWNSNMYQEEAKNVRYSKVGHAFHNGFVGSEDCVTVTEKNDSNFFQNEQIYEVYAAGIGLIYRFATETETQNERVSGYLVRKTLIRYEN